MNYTLTEEKACKRVFRVELTGEEYRQARQAANARLASRIDIPGFRKGKVPPQVLEQRLGSRVEEETVEQAVNVSARRILGETKLLPVTNPTVTNVQKGEGGMTFHLTVELAPEVVLGDYEGLDLEREEIVVRPEEIDSVIEGLRRRNASYNPVERPARWGDLAVIDYEGKIDGQTFEGGSGKDVAIFIGSGEAMRELEESVVGHRTGDEYLADVGYPADHVNRDLAGKTATLAVSVKDLKEAVLPVLDDEFVVKLGGEYRTLEELRKAIAARLRAERDQESRGRLRSTVVERLLKFIPGEVAPSLIEEEMQFMAVRGAEELGRQGMRDISQLRLDPKGFREMFRPAATRSVREAFVLEAIARKEGIAITDGDLEGEIRKTDLEDKGASPEKLVASLKSSGRWERLRHRLQQDRTLDWIIGKAKVTEKALNL